MKRLSSYAVIVAIVTITAAGCGGPNPMNRGAQATPAPVATPAAVVTPAAVPSAAPSIAAPPPSVAPGAPVSNLQLTASTSTQIPPGGNVSLALAFNLEGQQPMTVETTIGWRTVGGEMKYGEFKTFNAAPGANAHRSLSLGVSDTTQVGTTFEVFGAIKANGQTYLTQTPLVVTVTAPQVGVSPVGPPVQATPVAEPTTSLPTPPQPPADARTAQLRTALQGKGLKVLEVGAIPAKDGNPPMVAAIVEADYAAPSGEAVLRQAFTVWDVLFHTMPPDTAPATLMIVGEHWTKFTLYLAITVEEAANYLKGVEAAGSDQQKQQELLQTLLQAIRFRVYDNEQKQFVDQKDFMDKNFSR